MAQQISKIIKSDTPPINTNTLWLDIKKNELKSYTPNGWKSVKGDSGNIKVKATSKKPIIVGRYIPINAEVGDRYFLNNGEQLVIKIKKEYLGLNMIYDKPYHCCIYLVFNIAGNGVFTVPYNWNNIKEEILYSTRKYIEKFGIERSDRVYGFDFLDKSILTFIDNSVNNSIISESNTSSPFVHIIDNALVINKPVNVVLIKREFRSINNNILNVRNMFIYKWRRRGNSRGRRNYNNSRGRKMSTKFKRWTCIFIKKYIYLKFVPTWRNERKSCNYIRVIVGNTKGNERII